MVLLALLVSRVMAAKLLGMAGVPTMALLRPSATERRAYFIISSDRP